MTSIKITDACEEHLVSIVRETLKAAGFRKKARNWWKDNSEVTFLFNLQKSAYGPQFYINLGIALKALEPDSKFNFQLFGVTTFG